MNVAAILLLSISQLSQPTSSGQVTIVVGGVVIQREGTQYRAVSRSGLEAGDEVQAPMPRAGSFSLPTELSSMAVESCTIGTRWKSVATIAT